MVTAEPFIGEELISLEPDNQTKTIHSKGRWLRDFLS